MKIETIDGSEICSVLSPSAGIQCDGEILPTCEDVATYAGLNINDITIATMPTSNSDNLPNTDLLIAGTYLIDYNLSGFAISANFTITNDNINVTEPLFGSSIFEYTIAEYNNVEQYMLT